MQISKTSYQVSLSSIHLAILKENSEITWEITQKLLIVSETSKQYILNWMKPSLVSKPVPAGSCCQACCYRSHGRQYNIWHNLMKPYSRLIWVQISFWITAKGSRLLKADTKAIPGLLTKAQLHFQHTPLHSPQAGSMLSRCTYHLLSVVIARTWCAPPFVSVLPFPAPSVTIENYRSANMMQLPYFEQNVTWL